MGAELKFKNFWRMWCHLTSLMVLVLCLLPSPGETPKFEYLDKFYHFGAYALLAFQYTQIWNKKRLSDLLTRLVVFGFIIEVLQLLSGYREFDLWDALANGLGALYGIFFGFTLGKGAFKFIETFGARSAP